MLVVNSVIAVAVAADPVIDDVVILLIPVAIVATPEIA